MDQRELIDLKIFAARIRLEAIRAIGKAGKGHIGGAMSMVETLAVLYGKVMQVDPHNPRMENRDRFVLSKGHAGPSLYAALAIKGFFPMDVMSTMNQGDTILPSHCDRNKTPGIDYSTGSLGQGISMASGAALAAKLKNQSYYTYCMVGDGECNEGQVWESVLFSAHHKLDQLIVFVDYNKQQLDGWTDEICGLGNLKKKFEEFGWFALEIDGHDLEAIDEAIQQAKNQKEKPSVIVLNTVKGKGCSYAEMKILCHSMSIPQEACDAEYIFLESEIARLTAMKED